MNRLVLLGNGFDLAHGMKTSYNDFILWYLAQCFTTAIRNTVHEDYLLKITISSRSRLDQKLGMGRVEEYLQEHYSNNTLRDIMGVVNPDLFFSFVTSDDHYYESTTPPMTVEVKSELLRKMIDSCSIDRWVDTENLFYSTLKQILLNGQKDKHSEVQELNQALSFIIKELHTYLMGLNTPKKINAYDRLLTGIVQPEDIIYRPPLTNVDGLGKIPQNLLLLNFNYTDTAQHYLKTNGRININHIHGQLQSASNPMIFGFGDELDNEYKMFESDRTKNILKYIKSFWYFKTSNYHNLIRFIQSEKFQVCIMGHSCGLSDRTMLNMIFEHNNCVSIKIYYFDNPFTGQNNYTELTEEISRHFVDKGEMRLKIVPFDKSSPMPQSSIL